MELTRSGFVRVLPLLPLALLPGCGRTVVPPSVTAGRMFFNDLSPPLTLTPSEVAAVETWLERHRSGWKPVFTPLPPALASIWLDTAEREEAIALFLELEYEERDGLQLKDRLVRLYSPARALQPKGAQVFSDEELGPLLAPSKRLPPKY